MFKRYAKGAYTQHTEMFKHLAISLFAMTLMSWS